MRRPTPRPGWALLPLLAVAVFLAACSPGEPAGSNPTPTPDGNEGSQPSGTPFLLASLPEVEADCHVTPALAQSLIFEEDEVFVLTGRVRDVNDRLYAIVLEECAGDDCETGSDMTADGSCPDTSCCSTGPSAVTPTMLPVRFVRNGTTNPVRIDAAPAFKVGDEVSLVGTFMRDNGGNPIFLATGYVAASKTETAEAN